ncbi:MAG: hypothetical protein Unbinned5081contig1002_48 [Prokaryotic dsDNA virus sp.]|nr:MAG: hypothetical protein Unbinned5081contig1002_48 [Prokaryotic dsDNA virus sp.]|tara:strand:+ start:22673 stop:22951 length:279 start_codon:yes stop_codon:yes gene_type:complete
MQKRYKLLPNNAQLSDVTDWIRQVIRERDVDLSDYEEQESTNVVYYSYTPTSSSDLIGTEKAGDIAADTSYIYIVVDNSGTLQWQRVATSTF